MLKRIPRPLFLINYFFYPILAVIVVLVVFFRLNADNDLSLEDLGILAALVALFALVWWRFHAQQSKGLPVNATAMMREIKHNHKYALLAFESEFCPACMTMGVQVSRIENSKPKELTIYRLSVNREPGHSLARQFDVRATPTYILVDPKGSIIMDWPIVLPAQRILYAVNHGHEHQPT